MDVRTWPDWERFEAALPTLGDPFFFSSEGPTTLWDAPLGAPERIVLVFGCESTGLPARVRDRYRDRLLAMPIASPQVRSLNLSTSVAVAVYEVLRQRRAR